MPADHDYDRNTTSQLRTFRLPQTTVSTLKSEARKRAISVNALVGAVILKFIGWDRFADQFHFIAITGDLLEAILSDLTDDEVEQVANTIGTRTAEEGMKFWPAESRVEGFITYLNNRCRYAGYGTMAYETKGVNHVLMIEHKLGRRWSIFLHHVTSNILTKLGIVAKFDIAEDRIIIHFRK